MLTAVEVGPRSAGLASAVSEAAERHGIPARSLLVESLLGLPRVADAAGHVDAPAALEEIDAVARRIAGATTPLADLARAPSTILEPRDLRLEGADQQTARVIIERFHYLHSFRYGSTHHAGVAGDRVGALLSLSPFDIGPLAAALPGLRPEETLVLSRVFAFDWMPHNSLSFLLARLRREVARTVPQVRLLVTYLNPNLGFDAASYRASNWALLARERGTRYAYLDGVYITDRELARRFGTSDPEMLEALDGPRIEFSSMELAPLEIYGYAMDPDAWPVGEGGVPLIERPTP